MAELPASRVVAIAAVAGALVGGAVAGVVAAASASGNGNTTSSSSGGSSLATARVVRTNLATTAQVGGAIGYGGSYTIAAPSGASPLQVAQVQQAVAQDQQALSADEAASSDAEGADNQTIAADQTNVDSALGTLSLDQATKRRDCRGRQASTPACSQDAQKISQDRNQLTQGQQQLAAARASATANHDQNRAKVGADETKLAGDRATLASLQASAINPGTAYTWLPKVGEVVKQNQPVYAVSDQPVPLLYGSIAAYRAFFLGMSDGADVGQLTRDLIGLRYGPGLSPSNHYSSATAAAVKRWQTALGLPATGEILLGQVVFEPGAIRVTSVTPSVGESVGGAAGGAGGGGAGGGGAGGGGAGGTVLTATSTTPIVTVDLDVSQEYLVKPGDAVSIVLPDGTSTVRGRIESVGNVATCPGGGGSGTGSQGGGSAAGQSPCESVGSGGSTTPTVTVRITLDRMPPGATLDQAPVNVNITAQRAENVLAVPVNALLALRGGGFGVDVVSGNTSRLVGVSTGLYSNTLVQISGAGISAGARVEVPAS